MNLADKAIQTTITIFPHYFGPGDASKVHVCCNIAVQTVAHFSESTTPSEIIEGLSYTPIQEIYCDAADIRDIPKRFVLTFGDEETRSSQSEESLAELTTSSSVPKTNLKPSLKAQSEMERSIQTDLSVKPFFLGMDTVAHVYCDVEVQTSAMFHPEADNEVVADYFKQYHVHDGTPRDASVPKIPKGVDKRPRSRITADDIANMCKNCCTEQEIMQKMKDWYDQVRDSDSDEELQKDVDLQKEIDATQDEIEGSMEDMVKLITDQLDRMLDSFDKDGEESKNTNDGQRKDEEPKGQLKEAAIQTEPSSGDHKRADHESCLGASFRHKSCDCGCHELEDLGKEGPLNRSHFKVASCCKCLCLAANKAAGQRRYSTRLNAALSCYNQSKVPMEKSTKFSNNLRLLYELDGTLMETYMELLEQDATATQTRPQDKVLIEVYKSPKVCTCIEEVELPWDDLTVVPRQVTKVPLKLKEGANKEDKSPEGNAEPVEPVNEGNVHENQDEIEGGDDFNDTNYPMPNKEETTFSDQNPRRSYVPNIPQVPKCPVYNPEQIKHNEPYMERLFALVDSESRIGGCTANVEIPWQTIELPKRVTLRKIVPSIRKPSTANRDSSLNYVTSVRNRSIFDESGRAMNVKQSRPRWVVASKDRPGESTRTERMSAMLDSCKREMEPIREGINQLRARIKELNLPDLVYGGVPYVTSSIMAADLSHTLPMCLRRPGTTMLYYPFPSWMFPDIPAVPRISQSSPMYHTRESSRQPCACRSTKHYQASPSIPTSSDNPTSETFGSIGCKAAMMGDRLRSSEEPNLSTKERSNDGEEMRNNRRRNGRKVCYCNKSRIPVRTSSGRKINARDTESCRAFHCPFMPVDQKNSLVMVLSESTQFQPGEQHGTKSKSMTTSKIRFMDDEKAYKAAERQSGYSDY